jgi:TM2 domain-containing membrane protein YozV
MSYYLGDGGMQRGPFEAQQLLAQGMRADSLVWKEGMVQWQPAGMVPELQSLLQSAPPALPAAYSATPAPIAYSNPSLYQPAQSKRILAGVMGILFGGWGIHKFVLGMPLAGFLQILITIATCGLGGLIGFIEGIIYLTKSDEQFYQQYMVQKRQWF